MTRSFVFLALGLTFLAPVLHAQIGTNTFCNAGLHPDGYVDFADLPPAPNFPTGVDGPPSPSAPITVTLPVHGIAGLTVQVTIPSIQPEGGGRVYSVSNGILTLNSEGPASPLGLLFSQPIKGMGFIGTVPGRGTTYQLSGDGPLLPPPEPMNFVNSVNILTVTPHFYSIPLQEVALSPGSFTMANVSGAGGDFGYPSFGNLRVQSTTDSLTTLVATEGLQLWLTSESASSQFAGGAASWPDESGNGRDATQTVEANQPSPIEQDGNDCRGDFSFGQNKYFNFALPIEGWKEMTIFMVAKSLADPSGTSRPSYSAGILWNENASRASTFLSPYQQTVSFRFGDAHEGNERIYTRPATIGQDFTVTRAVHDGSTDSLYVDGLLVLSHGARHPVLSGTNGTGYIGRGANGTYFDGDISEILVYDRVLSAEEAASVEYYLRNKFGTR